MAKPWKENTAEPAKKRRETTCAGCGKDDALVMLKTNADTLGHAKHGLLCGPCWSVWMKGKQWIFHGRAAPEIEGKPTVRQKNLGHTRREERSK